MTPEAQRIAIALACGAKWYLFLSGYYWLSIKELTHGFNAAYAPEDSDKIVIGHSVPDYLNDLNAIIPAIAAQPIEIQDKVAKLLGCHMDYSIWISTTPGSMCEALIHALEKWDDSK